MGLSRGPLLEYVERVTDQNNTESYQARDHTAQSRHAHKTCGIHAFVRLRACRYVWVYPCMCMYMRVAIG